MEHFLRSRVVRKPVFSFHVFAVRLKNGERQRRRVHIAQIRYPLAVGFNDFKIFFIDPDDAVEIAVLSFKRFGIDLKNIAINFVYFFVSQKLQVVLRELRSGHGIGGNPEEGLNILRLEIQLLK